MLRTIIAAAALLLSAPVAAGPAAAGPVAAGPVAAGPVAAGPLEARLPITLPFHLKNGLILVDGRVDQTAGVFVLDTGETYFRFLLNRSYVPLGRGVNLYNMRAASGQTSMTQAHQGAHSIVLANAVATTAESGDPGAKAQSVSDDFHRMMRNVDPHLLGVVGYPFLRRYDFTVDYQRQIVTLYPLGAAPIPAGSVRIKFVPASPVAPFLLRLGDIQIPTVIDTGGWEELRAPEAVWSRLLREHQLEDAATEGANCVTLTGAKYGSSARGLRIPHVNRVVAPQVKLTLGYPFLRHYLSIYSSRQGIVSLAPMEEVSPLPPQSCE